MRREWNAQVINSVLYVWGIANEQEITAVREMMHNPFSIGTAENGFLYPMAPKAVTIPPSIPDGALVGITGGMS